MELNSFLWNNFKESVSGTDLYLFFKNYKQNLIENRDARFYKHLRSSIAYKGTLDIDFDGYLKDISELYSAFMHDENNSPVEIEIQSIDEAEEFYKEILNINFIDENGNSTEFIFSADDVSFLSEALYCIAPKYFFPYYFDRLYQDVIEIFNSFGLFLPTVPRKNDREGRFLHYFELCKSLYQFRMSANLDEYDAPAFLYGFAINIIKRYKVSENLPPPRKAFIVGGGKKDSTVDSSGDFDYLDNARFDSVSNWNGNPEIQTGDIVIMYCLAPRSCIHSIWRAVTPGSVDPFFHYYKNINIGKPIFVKNISLSEIKEDPILSELSLVRANMQGINGRVIPKKQYDHVLEILERKGQDITILPQLEDYNLELPELCNEKDVEIMLLEPLLKKIGYAESDWLKQMKLRMGRGDRVYPDYVIFPHEERNNEYCHWIWEAKYSISSHKQLIEDFGQAKSYALRLNSNGLGLVSKEGVWLSTPDYSIDKIRYWSWKQLNSSECITEVFDIAGKKSKKKDY